MTHLDPATPIPNDDAKDKDPNDLFADVTPNIRRKRSFTMNTKRISDTMLNDFSKLYDFNRTEFKKKTAALLRDNPDLFNMNEIGTIADNDGLIHLDKFQSFLSGLISSSLSLKIFTCIDSADPSHKSVHITAITRFLSGIIKTVPKRQQTVIDENWLITQLKQLDIGQIDEDGNNKIELNEFKHYWLNLNKDIPQDLIVKIFNDIDKNKDGHITTFEYFKWKDGFKQHNLHQLLPSKIRKSTTKLKLLNADYNKSASGSGLLNDDDDIVDAQLDNLQDEIKDLKDQITKLQTNNLNKDNIITKKNDNILSLTNNLNNLKQDHDKLKTELLETGKLLDDVTNDFDKLTNDYQQTVKTNEIEEEKFKKQIIDLTKSNNNCQNLHIQKDANIDKYIAEIKALKDNLDKDYNVMLEYQNQKKQAKKDYNNLNNLYKTLLDEIKLKHSNNNDKDDDDDDDILQQLRDKDDIIASKNARILKIEHENAAQIEMIEKDKYRLYHELEATYNVINNELINPQTNNKKSNKRIKDIQEPEQLKYHLQKLKKKINKLKKDKNNKNIIKNNNNDDDNNDNNIKQIDPDIPASGFQSLWTLLKDW